MHFYDSAPIWKERNQCPNTCKTAKPCATSAVSNARVISVVDAEYRNATFSGKFVLGELEGKLPDSGWHDVKVYCRWFGHRLKTGPITIKVNGKTTKYLPNYSGEVVSNLSR